MMQNCRRHPSADPSTTTCSSCAQELYDTAVRSQKAAAEAALVSTVRNALGLPGYGPPRPEAGETPTRVSMWSVRELQDVYARVGGTVTIRQVERPYSCGTFTTHEITVTVTLPDVGEVQVFTDWDPEEGCLDLPVIQALTAPRT